MGREIQVLVGMSCFAMYANSNVSRSFYCASCVKKCDGLEVSIIGLFSNRTGTSVATARAEKNTNENSE